MKTLVAVNVLESVNSFVYSSHCKLWVEMKAQFPNDEFLFFTPYRMSIDNMRNHAAKIALAQNCDYLMFIDDDVIVLPETYKSLREADKDIVMALTFVRSHPFPPMFFTSAGVTEDSYGKKKELLDFFYNYKEHVDERGLVDCIALGFSCVLIKCDLLKALDPPYFVTGPGHTEDVYFCLKAKYSLQPEPTIAVDTKVPTAHIMMADAVCEANVEELRALLSPEKPVGKTRFERTFEAVRLMGEREMENAST